MTIPTSSRGRRRAPTRIERAAGRAAALQRPRVILALLLLLALTCVMLLDGYLRAEVGGDQRVRTGAGSGKVPDKILNGGPILTFRGGQATTVSVPAKTIALTFDDGPNPTWTPKVLEILRKYDVPGTFFLVGSMVSRYPGIVKTMVRQGNEVGVHTFTHVDLSYQSDARIKREMEQTQLALAGAAGITTTLWGPPVTRPVSVIVPAYNEKECIANTLESLARSTHPIEIIVVDDGSTDGTSEIARAAAESLGMTNVRVIRQENAGKPAALNNGVRSASYDIVVMMDGDTVFEPETVRHLVQPFADPSVGAVAGNAKVGNRNTVIGAWQHIEYVMGFNLDRRMYDLLRCMPTIPGAIGAFRREAVLAVGEMSEDTLAEDTDITIALHRAGWRVVYQEHAKAWTEAPGSLKQLWSQRYRWSYGTMQALWKHRKSLTDKGASGRFGRVGMPLVVIFQIVTPVFAPLIDVFTVYSMIFVDFRAALLAWLAVLGIQLACAAYAFRLDSEKYRYLLMMPLQQLAYRQMMYLVLIHSCITALTGGRLRWQKLKRTGEVGTPAGVS
ncbi:bifunctional polysaccharide deacetylase/glycosyltransferase family 2 protein [Streptomyces sp. NPDC003996]